MTDITLLDLDVEKDDKEKILRILGTPLVFPRETAESFYTEPPKTPSDTTPDEYIRWSKLFP